MKTSMLPTSMTKIIISPFPSSFSKNDFFNWVDPLPPYNYFSYHQPSLGFTKVPYSYACVNFLDINDVFSFSEGLCEKSVNDEKSQVFKPQCKFAVNQSIPKIQDSGLCEDNVYSSIVNEEDIRSDPSFVEFLKAEEKQSSNNLEDTSTTDKTINDHDTPLVMFLKSLKEDDSQSSLVFPSSNVASNRIGKYSCSIDKSHNIKSASPKIINSSENSNNASTKADSRQDGSENIKHTDENDRFVSQQQSVRSNAEKHKPKWSQPYQSGRRGSLLIPRTDARNESRHESKYDSKNEYKSNNRYDIKKDPKSHSRYDQKGDSRSDQKRESKYEPRNESKYEPKNESKYEPRNESKYEPRNESRYERGDRRYESKHDPQYPSRSDSRYGSKEDLRYASRIDARYESRGDSRYDQRTDLRGEPKGDSRYDQRRELKYEPKAESRYNVRNDSRYESRNDSRYESRYEPRSDSRYESKAESKYDLKEDSRYDPRSDSRYDSRNDSRYKHKNETRYDTRKESKYDSRFHYSDSRFDRKNESRFDLGSEAKSGTRIEKTGLIENHIKGILGIQKPPSPRDSYYRQNLADEDDSNKPGVWLPRNRTRGVPRRLISSRDTINRNNRGKVSRGYWGPTDDWD